MSASNASTVKELEDFIDESFNNVSLLLDTAAYLTDVSIPDHRCPEGNLAKLEAQFLSFKENVEVQIKNL